MKHSVLILMMLAASAACAQISITKRHFVGAGKKLVQARSNNGDNRAASGQNIHWDYSDLNADQTDTLRFGMPDWYAGSENFPDANLAYKNSNDENTVVFLKTDENGFSMSGFYNLEDGEESYLILNSKALEFPSTYGSAFSENILLPGFAFELATDPDSSGPLPFIDSIKVNILKKSESLIDGWGSISTPLGNFPALKQTVVETGTQTFEMKTNGIWITIPPAVLALIGMDPPQPDTSYNVFFWTNDVNVGFPLLSYSYKPGDMLISSVNWLAVKPSASSLAENSENPVKLYPNPVQDVFYLDIPGGTATLEIYDAQGRLLIKRSVASDESVSVAELPPGVYTATITDKGSLLGKHKILKS